MDSKQIVSILSSASDMDNRSSSFRDQVLMDFKGKNVPFTSVQKALIEVYKKAGVYPKQFNGKTGKSEWKPYKDHLALNDKWAHDIRRFVSYVKKTYVSYDKKKADVPKTPVDLKAKQYDKNMRAVQSLNELMSEMHNEFAVMQQIYSD